MGKEQPQRSSKCCHRCGKTILVIAAIALLREKADLKVKIVVPKASLMYQWHGTLCKEMQIPIEKGHSEEEVTEFIAMLLIILKTFKGST